MFQLQVFSTKDIFLNFFKFIEFWILFGFLGLMITSIYFSFLSLKGRLNPNEFSNDPVLNNSKIFWGSISAKNPTDYFTELEVLQEIDFTTDLRNQVYINSKICTLKFKYYNKMLRCTSIAYILLVVYCVIKIKS